MEENPLIGHTLRGGGEGGGGTDRSKFIEEGIFDKCRVDSWADFKEDGQCLGQSIYIFIYFC